jgi:hypothetical protein
MSSSMAGESEQKLWTNPMHRETADRSWASRGRRRWQTVRRGGNVRVLTGE